MSKNKDRAPMPQGAAGLLRFFEDSASGIQIKPIYMMLFSVGFAVISLLLRFFPIIS